MLCCSLSWLSIYLLRSSSMSPLPYISFIISLLLLIPNSSKAESMSITIPSGLAVLFFVHLDKCRLLSHFNNAGPSVILCTVGFLPLLSFVPSFKYLFSFYIRFLFGIYAYYCWACLLSCYFFCRIMYTSYAYIQQCFSPNFLLSHSYFAYYWGVSLWTSDLL